MSRRDGPAQFATVGELSTARVAVAHTDRRLLLAPETDIVVATPGCLLAYATDQSALFGGPRSVRTVIVDEADVMLAGGLAAPTRRIMEQLRTPLQRIFIAATLPRLQHSARLAIERMCTQLEIAASDGLHRKVPTVHEQFVRVPGSRTDTVRGSERAAALLRLLQQPPAVSTLVFVSSLERAKALCDVLRENGLACVALHAAVPPEQRVSALAELTAGSVTVAVCTDLASRGLDLPYIQCVVQYDFAYSAVDYLHRAGRTARMGAAGSVVNFVTPEDELIASAIEHHADVSLAFRRGRQLRRRSKRCADAARAA